MIAVIARWISLITGGTLLITGTIGAIFDILVFSHRTLRTCPCSWYMFTAAFFDLITLDHALLLRILSEGFGIDAISIHTIYCQLRFYTGQIASFVPITLICLAAVDRWASTCRSVRIRQWSCILVVRYSILITIIVWSVLSVPNLLVYQVVNGTCKQTSITYNDYTVFFLNPILYGLLPVTVLGLFGYATYRNIHQLTSHQRRNRGKVEAQLTRAVILHCTSFIISQVPYTLWNLYLTVTRYDTKSSFRLDLETLFTQFTRILFYFNYVLTFYINFIASRHIRKVTKFYLCLIIGRRIPIDNRIYPLTNTVSRSQPHAGKSNVIQPVTHLNRTNN